MARLGRSSTPLDLLTYSKADAQPSIFLLKEDNRQSILTVFNWTETAHDHTLKLADLGLRNPDHLQIIEIFGAKDFSNTASGTITFNQPAHSVRIFKLVDEAVPATPPAFDLHSEKSAKAGDTLSFTVSRVPDAAPALTVHWDFGDGTTGDGFNVHHAYTQSGEYTVRVTATGLESAASSKAFTVRVSGNISTRFVVSEKKRPE